MEDPQKWDSVWVRDDIAKERERERTGTLDLSKVRFAFVVKTRRGKWGDDDFG